MEGQRDIELKAIGNLVHDSVPVSNDEVEHIFSAVSVYLLLETLMPVCISCIRTSTSNA